jgi:hypothetical protein
MAENRTATEPPEHHDETVAEDEETLRIATNWGTPSDPELVQDTHEMAHGERETAD